MLDRFKHKDKSVSRRKFLTDAARVTLAELASRRVSLGHSLFADHHSSIPPFACIDAHTHVFLPDPAFYDTLKRLQLQVVNICVVDKYEIYFAHNDANAQHAAALDVFRKSNNRAPWISTFDPSGWESQGFADRVIQQLDKTFQDGALGVKIYKCIGMNMKSRAGKYLMPDDPVFDPIFEHIAAKGKTLYAHIAEPRSAWRPFDPSDFYSSYYQKYPEYNMYAHPERPSKDTILAARDRMLKKHPNLRVVGCHLGSMEEDVDAIARRLELYPNFVVDTAARMESLMFAPPEKVKAFLIKYQDRVLYGSDQSLDPGNTVGKMMKRWQYDFVNHWKSLATTEAVSFAGRKTRGLALPEPVLRKIFHENAVKWVPGVKAA